jgi:hypothetical protein
MVAGRVVRLVSLHETRPRAVFKLRYGIAAMCEPAMGVPCGNGRQDLSDRQLQRRAGACLGGTQEGFDLRPGLLDGREIRRVRRQVEELGPAPLNSLTNGYDFMSAQVIQHDDLARAQRWAKDVLRVCFKDVGIRGPLDRHDGLDAVQGEGRNHGKVGAIVLWHRPDDALSPRGAAEPPRHGQVDTRLIDKFEAPEIERLNQRG